MITIISGFGFFWSKKGRLVTHNRFSKNGLLKPHCYSVWGARFSAKLSKREILDPHQNKRKICLITEKLIFCILGCFFHFSLFFLCFAFYLFVFVFFGGFKGQVRWPERSPHLALNPPYLFFCFSIAFSFLGKGCPHSNVSLFLSLSLFALFFAFVSWKDNIKILT